MYQIYTAFKVEDEDFRKQYVRNIEGKFKIVQDKSFGFVDDIFVHPSLIQKNGLKNADIIKCMVIKSYNPAKKQLSWKVANINEIIRGE
jgi:transcription termination factor Rho